MKHPTVNRESDSMTKPLKPERPFAERDVIVRQGDVFQDRDPRCPERRLRLVRIDGSYAVMQHVSGRGMTTRVRLNRLLTPRLFERVQS